MVLLGALGRGLRRVAGVLAVHLLVLAVGVLFITDFRFRKPTNKELAVLVAVVGVAVLRGLLIWKGGRTI